MLIFSSIISWVLVLVFDIRMIILVLCRRTNAERQHISLAYKKKYEKVHKRILFYLLMFLMGLHD